MSLFGMRTHHNVDSQKFQIHTQGKGLGGLAEKMFSEWTAGIEYWCIDNRTILDEFLSAFS